VKGTLHWLSAIDAVPAQVRLYEPILLEEQPEMEADLPEDEELPEQAPVRDFIELLNPDSLKVVEGALVEPVIAQAEVGQRFQFLRTGYFCKDPDSTPQRPVYNRIVPLRDSWAKINR
jgi:glutaminyl-tRNA synthetase